MLLIVLGMIALVYSTGNLGGTMTTLGGTGVEIGAAGTRYQKNSDTEYSEVSGIFLWCVCHQRY